MAEVKKQAKIIIFYNRKGGVGKTTLSGNFAAYLSKQTMKKKGLVLYLDMDPQTNATTTYLGFDKEVVSNDPRTYPNILNLVGVDIPELDMHIKKEEDPRKLIRKAPNFNLYTILSNTKIDVYWNKDMLLQDNYAALIEPLNKIREYFEYIIIDVGPSQDYLTCSAITASDYIIFPADCSKSSVDNMGIFFNEMYPLFKSINPGLKILGLICNRYDRNKFSFYEDTLRPVAEEFGIYLYDAKINSSTGLNDPSGKAIKTRSGLDRCVVCFDRFVKSKYPTAYADIHTFVLETMARIAEMEENSEEDIL